MHSVVPDDFDVTISSDSATSHAGQELTLTCTATAVEGLLYPLKVEWLDSLREKITTSGDITVGSAETSGLTTTTTLRFNPLRLSHAGDITCRASISTLAPPHNFSTKADWEQIVAGNSIFIEQSYYVCVYIYIYIYIYTA